MNKHLTLFYFLFLSFSVQFISCNNGNTVAQDNFGAKTKEFIQLVESNPDIKSMLIAAIKKGREINPDTITNPVNNLDDFYHFISWAETTMPSALAKHEKNDKHYQRAYFYFISDMPLAELGGKGYYNNSLQYHEPYRSWMTSFNLGWGNFLNSKESWNNDYYQLALKDDKFGLKMGWYEDHSNWKTFNDFFSRRLKSPNKRPIASPEDESVVVSSADAVPQGVWDIDNNSNIIEKQGVPIKSGTLYSIKALLGEDSKYKDVFAGGTFTHTFLDVGDYHRYHFPLSGVIKEAKIIPEKSTTGGYITWDAQHKRYAFSISPGIGWQSIETRGRIILETKKYGLVALLPVGMAPVSSVNFGKNVKPEMKVAKGDEIGFFLFGGSDFIMVFQKQAGFVLDAPKGEERQTYKHLLMGERYGKLTRDAKEK